VQEGLGQGYDGEGEEGSLLGGGRGGIGQRFWWQMEEGGWETYQTYPQMYIFIRQEPMHSRPLVGEGMWIFPRGLRFLFGLWDG